MASTFNEHALEVIEGFQGTTFNTLEFINAFKSRFPKEWGGVVKKYGKGGQGNGKPFTANVWAGQLLRNMAQKGELTKLAYSPDVPEGWGSTVIRRWRGTGKQKTAASKASAHGRQKRTSDYPDEIPDSPQIVEGAKKTITVNAYERDPKGRRICIKKWGAKCAVCEFDFGEVYGALGKGFIHVHHLVPIALRQGEYKLHAEKDLRPVCPNCHAMLHRAEPVLGIEKLKEVRKQAKGNSAR